VLTRRQIDKIRARDKAKYERNDALFDLLSEDACDKFLTALQRTDHHVMWSILSLKMEVRITSNDLTSCEC